MNCSLRYLLYKMNYSKENKPPIAKFILYTMPETIRHCIVAVNNVLLIYLLSRSVCALFSFWCLFVCWCVHFRAKIIVLQKPQIVYSPSNVSILRGGNAKLRCSARGIKSLTATFAFLWNQPNFCTCCDVFCQLFGFFEREVGGTSSACVLHVPRTLLYTG